VNFNQNDLIPCEQVLPNIVLYIDHEIFDTQELSAVKFILVNAHHVGLIWNAKMPHLL